MEAKITVTARVAGGVFQNIAMTSTRLPDAARLFTGRPLAEVLNLIPAVFSLCGTAQRLCGLAAVENAAGLPPQARPRPLLAETLVEHGTALARDWPVLLGEAPDLKSLKALRAARHAPPPDLLADLLDTVPPRLLAHLDALGLAEFGQGPPRPEAGPFSRHQRHFVSNGLKNRFLARVVETRAAMVAFATAEDLEITIPAVTDGVGTASVEAARGTLTHSVRIEGGLVRDWRIAAPTDINFHPDGPLVHALSGQPAGDNPEHRVRLLVAAFDPCVACEIEVILDA